MVGKSGLQESDLAALVQLPLQLYDRGHLHPLRAGRRRHRAAHRQGEHGLRDHSSRAAQLGGANDIALPLAKMAKYAGFDGAASRGRVCH